MGVFREVFVEVVSGVGVVAGWLDGDWRGWDIRSRNGLVEC